jgi:hypothetical protein
VFCRDLDVPRRSASTTVLWAAAASHVVVAESTRRADSFGQESASGALEGFATMLSGTRLPAGGSSCHVLVALVDRRIGYRRRSASEPASSMWSTS